MGMIYRTDVFEKYGITPPTTWDEYEAAAQKVKDAGGPLFGDFGANVPAVDHGAHDPERRRAVHLRPGQARGDRRSSSTTTPPRRCSTTGPASSKKGLVGTQDQFTPEYISGVVGGDYATYVSAAWAPGYLTGAGVGEGADAGHVARSPRCRSGTPANPVSVNWGGSAFSVTQPGEGHGARRQGRARRLRRRGSLEDGWQNQIIFPLNHNVLTSDEFVNAEVAFFNGQQANKEVYVPAANAYKGITYTPVRSYYYAALTKQIAAINDGKTTGSEAADDLQAKHRRRTPRSRASPSPSRPDATRGRSAPGRPAPGPRPSR